VRVLGTLLALAALVMLTGCQTKVVVDTKASKDGSGVVRVGVGLDDRALERVGDLGREVKTEDLVAAGWTVTPPAKEPDGLTWLRASKPFATPGELTKVMAELTGADGMFRNFAFERVETDDDITYRLKGTVDPTKGIAQFSDPELTARLNGDPFGGNVQAIEAREGKPVADMVAFDVIAAVAEGPVQIIHPTLKDKQATPLDASFVEIKPPPLLLGAGMILAAALGGVTVVAMLVTVRRRFRRSW
jgi:hypothetical protein